MLDLPAAKCEEMLAPPEALCKVSTASFSAPPPFCHIDYEMTIRRAGGSTSLQTGEGPRFVSTGCTGSPSRAFFSNGGARAACSQQSMVCVLKRRVGWEYQFHGATLQPLGCVPTVDFSLSTQDTRVTVSRQPIPPPGRFKGTVSLKSIFTLSSKLLQLINLKM